MGYTSEYPTQDIDHVNATSYNANGYWYPYFCTDPSKPLTGGGGGNSWQTAEGIKANIRFHIDLGSAKTITRIYYENSKGQAGGVSEGVQNFTFWGSNDAADFADLVFNNDGNWVQLTTAQSTWEQHVDEDIADPKYILVTNITAYRYYAFKFTDNWGNDYFMGCRRIELQSGTAPVVSFLPKIMMVG